MGTKRKLWITGVWVTVVCMAVSGAKLPLTTNGIDWGTNYYNPDKRSGGAEYDGLPVSASPAWISAYNTGSYSLEENYLRIVTKSNRGGEAETRQIFSITTGWDLTDDAVVEATLRVVENIKGLPAAGAQQICYGNPEIRSFIGFTKDGIRTSAGTYYRHDMTKWTTVRLMFKNMKNPALAEVEIFVNGGTEPVLINRTWYPTSTQVLNSLRFGDMNAPSGGTVDWESIRWRCNAASDRASAGMEVTASAGEPYIPCSEKARNGWGLLFNEDGDFSITDPDPEIAAEYIRNMLKQLAGTPVKTVMHSIGAASDILYYPSEYGSYWGWRKLPKYEDHAVWGPRIRAGRGIGEAGADMLMVAAETVTEMGLYFVPSVRMNDSHFVSDPLNYPLTGKFWMENQDKTIGTSPVAGYDYSALLNFLHEEVRTYRMRIITEVINRYAAKMDGLELDFNRVQIFFPAGKAEEGMPVMTDLVREIRTKLDQKGEETGKNYALFVRIPPALKNCRWSGLDIETWAKEKLVDVVIPSQLMTIAHDMPVKEFVDLCSSHGVSVFPTIYERTQYNAPMSGEIPSEIIGKDFARIVTPAQAAGVIMNACTAGAAGFQLYNFDMPLRSDDIEIMDYANDPQLICDRAYMVTAGYFMDHEDNYQYRKQLPLPITSEESHSVVMVIGENLSDPETKEAVTRTLRFGFSKVLAPDTKVKISINGETVYDGMAKPVLVPVSGASRGAKSYLYVSLDKTVPFQQGDNTLLFAITSKENTAFDLVEAQLYIARGK